MLSFRFTARRACHTALFARRWCCKHRFACTYTPLSLSNELTDSYEHLILLQQSVEQSPLAWKITQRSLACRAGTSLLGRMWARPPLLHTHGGSLASPRGHA
jgi:hypothetical protein